MATRFFCDRCGKEIDGNLYSDDKLLPDNLVLKYPPNYWGEKEHSKYFSLCPACLNAVLNDFISGSHKKQNKESNKEKENETKHTVSIFKAITCILFICGILGLLFSWNKIVIAFLFVLSFEMLNNITFDSYDENLNNTIISGFHDE